jgi:hypothetical protein
MLILTGNKEQLTRILAPLIEKVEKEVTKELQGIRSLQDLSGKVKELKIQLADFEIQRDKKQEEYDRRAREIEHKVGLERKRQEQELTLAKREALVGVREENLTADRKRFEEQMKFHDERFTGEVKYLKDMMKDVLDRLPNINASLKLGGGTK